MGFKAVYYLLRPTLLRMRGYILLKRRETMAFMSQYSVKSLPGSPVMLSQTANAGDPKTAIFQDKQIFTEPVYVWEYTKSNSKGKLSRYGSVIIGGRVLCTDWTIDSFYKDVWKPDTRASKEVPTFIALFSQHQDGIMYGGYFDYVFHIAAKLCRIKDAFPEEDFSKLFISYPIFKTAYETEFLALLDIDADHVIDSRETELVSSNIITGNSAHWYPNIHDILSLKRHIFKKVQPVKTTSKRIYISRSRRRNIVNEKELIALLKKFDFFVIEDKPRSIAEQISIYYNASFILGPHGASFSNVIWCQPSAHLMELFSPNYAPDFFLYLATVMNMTYSAYYEGTADSSVSYTEGLVEDIYVSIPKLESYLKDILIDSEVSYPEKHFLKGKICK